MPVAAEEITGDLGDFGYYDETDDPMRRSGVAWARSDTASRRRRLRDPWEAP